MPTTKTHQHAKQSAAECYAELYAECQELAQRITQRLEQHRQEQQETPTYWTHAGDLRHVVRQLAYSLAFLGDRSAVDKHGLEY